MRARRLSAVSMAAAALAAVALAGSAQPAAAVLPPGSSVQQWNKIAEDTVVGSGTFPNEGVIYMGYVSAAVYDAVTAIEGGYTPYVPVCRAPAGASVDAAVAESAYRTLAHYFPAQATALDAFHSDALALVPDGAAKARGEGVGARAAAQIIELREGDGRLTPIGTTSPFPTASPGPGVWRRTPPFAAPQTPWVASVRPFILASGAQFLPGPPPRLSSSKWARAFNEIKAYGRETGSSRTDEQTAIARFFTASAVRQYNRAVRDLADARALGLLQTARLAAMVNVVGADAQISVMFAKYHYLFWRPVTAIDPSAVTADGYGPVPGYDDGTPATAEETGWRPLIVTPNHPEYPAAHGSFTSAMAEVFGKFLGTNRIALDLHGFDAAGPAGNLDAVHHYERVGDLRSEIINARLWGGLHYRFSGVAGVALGRKVAQYDLRHAFRATR